MNISKVYDAFVNYNPISLSLDGVNFLLKKGSLEMKIFAVFFSIIPSLLAYFTRKFAEASLLPYFMTILSPLEFGALTFIVTFLTIAIFFGIVSKRQTMQNNTADTLLNKKNLKTSNVL